MTEGSMKIFIAIFLFSLSIEAMNFSRPEKLNWKGVEVHYIEDSRFPTFDMVFYFDQGALLDGPLSGLTHYTFQWLTLGMDKNGQQISEFDILDQYETYSNSPNYSVVYDYSLLSLKGLSKDMKDLTLLTCQLLNHANYPVEKVNNELDKEKSLLESSLSQYESYASRAFRHLQLKGTKYEKPITGLHRDLIKINSESLKKNLQLIMSKSRVKLYLTGPRSILSVRDTIENDCRFKSDHSVEHVNASSSKMETIPFKINAPKMRQMSFYFMPVEGANQVYVSLGSTLVGNYGKRDDLAVLASEVLTGGFSSILMNEIRTKRGLSYGIQSTIAEFNDYGRSIITSFSKNETYLKLIDVTLSALQKIKQGKLEEERVEKVKKGVIAAQVFKYELPARLLMEKLEYDYMGLDFNQFDSFDQEIRKITGDEIRYKINQSFLDGELIIFALGNKALYPEFKKHFSKRGKVKLIEQKEVY